MDVLSSTPVSLWVDFEAPQGLVTPDVGTTFYSLYDSAGAPLAVQQALTPEANATGVSVKIAALNNVLLPDHDFERRQVIVDWVAGGQSYTKRLSYRIVPLQNHSVTAETVRTYLAINEDELRDDEVDVYTAQLTLENVVGRQVLADALSSGTITQVRAERAIMLTAAVSLFPSLRYRIAQSKTDGTAKFERLRDAGAFAGLVSATTEELSGIAAGLVGDTSAAEAIPVIMIFAGRTIDPVTGVAPAIAGG